MLHTYGFIIQRCLQFHFFYHVVPLVRHDMLLQIFYLAKKRQIIQSIWIHSLRYPSILINCQAVKSQIPWDILLQIHKTEVGRWIAGTELYYQSMVSGQEGAIEFAQVTAQDANVIRSIYGKTMALMK